MVEAQQAAAGDIPDNQVFLEFRNAAEGYAMKYPEGWAQRGSGGRVTFQDKNNLVRVVIAKGSAATVAGTYRRARAAQTADAVAPLRGADANDGERHAGREGRLYDRERPNPVTGKRVKLVVDRYYIAGAGKHAVVDLGTPEGVDNVDAYRLMIESFRWT